MTPKKYHFVKSADDLPFWKKWFIPGEPKRYLMDRHTGNVYICVEYNDELYLVDENPLNRKWGTA